MPRLVAALLGFAAWFAAGIAAAHDPSAYGGMFRSRNLGTTWLNADVGLFLNAVLAVAVDPTDPAHLLMGTDLGVLRSRNGGRSWSHEATGTIMGAVFGLAFLADGKAAIAGAPSGVFRFEDGRWTRADAPDDAAPSRSIAVGTQDGAIYLLGRKRLFRSEDRGRSFTQITDSLATEAEVTAIAVVAGASQLLAIVDGRLMMSRDGGRRWTERTARLEDGPPGAPIEFIAPDPASSTRIWLARADRLHVSDDVGETWRRFGRPLPESGTVIRGIAADASATILNVTSHRGMFRSEDGGDHWALKEGNLPVHLESGPLFRDPSDPQTLYAVYSLLPYPEAWRVAIEGGNLLARVDRVSLAGGLAFLLLLILSGALSVRWLNARRMNAIPSRRPLS